MTHADEWVTVRDAARLRGCSEALILRRVYDGRVRSQSVPRTDWAGGYRRLVSRVDVVAMPVGPARFQRGNTHGIASRHWSGPPTDETIARLWRVMGELGIGSLDAVLEAFR